MSGSKNEWTETESYDETAGGWVLETRRIDRKVAELDVELLRTLGKKARIVGDESETR